MSSFFSCALPRRVFIPCHRAVSSFPILQRFAVMLHKQDKCQSSARTEGCGSPGAVGLVLVWQLCPLTQSLAGPWVGSVWQSGHPLSSLKAGAHLTPLCGEVTQNSSVCQCSSPESWDEFVSFHQGCSWQSLQKAARASALLALWGEFTVSPTRQVCC